MFTEIGERIMIQSKDEVMKQIDRMYSNTAVTPEQTHEDLMEIRDQVEGMIQCLEDENDF